MSLHNGRVKPRHLIVPALALLVGYGVGIAQPIVVRDPLVVGQDAVVDGDAPRVTLAEAGGDVLVIDPPDGEARVAFVLYPGGLVRPQAYEWIGHALAGHGVRTLIPEMPFDLAVLGSDRAGRVAAELAPGLDVVVGGHSLGGVMAAAYAGANPGEVDGLVLLAAYPSDGDDLAAAEIPTLSLMAEHDGLADEGDVRGGLARLPADTRLTTIDGAVHSFFGRYGPQVGDGVPTVPRAAAEAQITGELVTFFDGVG